MINWLHASFQAGSDTDLLLVTACDFARHCMMVAALVYYGLSLSAGQLAGNFYVNNFITGLVEIPAYTSCFFAMQ